MSMSRVLSDEVFELTVEYEGHPPGTLWWCYEAEVDFLAGGVLRGMTVHIAGQRDVERWTTPGAWSRTVEGLTKPARGGDTSEIDKYLERRRPARGRR